MSTLCEIDGSQLSGKAIYSHNKLHLNSEYECLLCHKIFQTKQYLQRHQKTVHIQQGISCDQCEKHFTKKADLKRHKNTVHKKKCLKVRQKLGARKNLKIWKFKNLNSKFKI